MINFIAKIQPIYGQQTITSVMEDLPIIASNNAIEQLTDRFRKRYEVLLCADHPDHLGNKAELSIPGGNVLKNNRFELLLTDFCCDHFQQHIRSLIERQDQDQDQPGKTESVE